MKRLLKWAVIILLTPAALLTLLILLFYFPPVQNWAVQRAAVYVSEQTGFCISIDRLRITPWLDLDARNVSMCDADGDTLLSAERAVFDLAFSHILDQRLGLECVALDGVSVNTKDLMAAVVVSGQLQHIELRDEIHLREHRVTIDEIVARGLTADVQLRDSVAEDTSTTAPLDWTFTISRVRIDDSHVLLAMTDTTRIALDSLALAADSLRLDLGREALHVPRLLLTTPSSVIDASVAMDFSALSTGAGGTMEVDLRSSFSKADILRLGAPWLPENLVDAYPDSLTTVAVTLSGNADSLTIERVEASLQGSLYMDACGDIAGLFNNRERQATLHFNLQTQDIEWVRSLVGISPDGLRLPEMQATGTAHIDGCRYETQTALHEGGGEVKLDGWLDTQGTITYDAQLSAHRFNLRHFIPSLHVSPLTAHATVRGAGTDFMNHAMRLDAEASIRSLTYDSLNLSGTQLMAHIAHGHAKSRVTTDSPLLALTADIEAELNRLTDITFSTDVSRVDFYGLGLVDKPLRMAMRMHVSGTTDLESRHALEGAITDIQLMPGDTLFRPEDVTLAAVLQPDTTFAHITSGDFDLALRGHTGYDQLLTQCTHFTEELQHQIGERRIDQQALIHQLPQVELRVMSGEHNPLHDIAASMDYHFQSLRVGLRLDPVTGIDGGGRILALKTGAILLDTIALHLYQDSTEVRLDARVHNNRRNPQITFDARMNAHLDSMGIARANLIYYDDRGRKGVDLGLLASMTDEGYRFHLSPLNPIVAYRTFNLNADNYLMLGEGNRLEANVDLLADDGTGLHIYTTPNDEALQDLTLSINRLNLGELMTVMPYAPRLTGFLQGDAHLIQTDEHLSVAADMNVDELYYEGARLGQVGVQAVYLPNTDGSHFVDVTLLHTGMPVATLSGTYKSTAGEGQLDIDATLDRLPFNLMNGFFPDHLASLEGVALGTLHLGGTVAKPLVDGEISTIGLRCSSEPYSLNLAFADQQWNISESDLYLSQVSVYSTGQQPFIIDGHVNFAQLDHITVEMKMSAKDFELINAKKTSKALAYGKAFVDFNAQVLGTLDDLHVRGRLKVLGNTDLTYVLTDSPLTVENQLDGLVEFVDFSDSTYVATEERKKPQHLDVAMSIEIDEASNLRCLLSQDGSNYVFIEGGGELMMTYSPDKDLLLNGRYTVNTGSIKYTMMGLLLKEFNIKNGSYVEFRGPLMNPTLNISATERVRTTITENDHPRSVNFDVGLNITQTLEQMGLEFTLNAPEDMSIQNDLLTMSAEQRGRLAVTMLATGMYVNDAGATSNGGVTGQNALNAFLQGQISNITNKALKSVDLSLGMEQGTSASGSTTTDYSFRFAKRFWGNRISIIVGGKVSTGTDAENTEQTLIDNVSIEYRLDKSATRYVNLFYDKNNESILDGDVMEMGAGLVLRRKTNKLGELFIFKRKE